MNLPTIPESIHAAQPVVLPEITDARDVLAAIRETHTIEPKTATGPLGGAR